MVAFKGILCVVVGFTLCSCQGKPVVKQELIGTYELESPSSSGYLELQADGTYRQKVTTTGGASKEAAGQWRYNMPRSGSVNRGTVIIYGPVLESEGFLKQLEPTFIKSLPVHGSGAELSLYVSPAGNEAYVKQ
jgi:hypothetical protein